MWETILELMPKLLLSIFCMISLLIVSKTKYKLSHILYIAIPITILLFYFYISIFSATADEDYRRWFVIIVFLPEAIFAALLGTRKKISLITAIMNAYISFYILFSTVSAFSVWLNRYYIIGVIIIGSILLFIYLKYYYVKIHNEIESTSPSFFKYLLLYASLMFTEITIYQFLIGVVENKHVLRLEIFGVAILSVYILSIILIYQLIKKYHNSIIKNKDNEWLENHLQYTMEQIKQQEKKNSEIRILHHDLRHILSTTSTLIQNKEYEESLEFINQYVLLINESRSARYCEDSLINAALEYYNTICEENDIKFNCKLNNIEDALKIPSHEVAVVISNCLENAINASLKLESDRLINFTFLNNDDRLVLKVENNYNGIITLDQNNKPVNLEENHGIGTASIQYFAKRNDLIVDYKFTDNKFKIRILFK